jgi:flavodoxin
MTGEVIPLRGRSVATEARAMRTLIVYYSRTGTTKNAAEGLAGLLGAELAAIRCERYPRGFFGYMRAGRDSMRGHLPPIDVPPLAKEPYDLMVIGSPVWAGHPSTPVRAFLASGQALPSRVGLFLTRMGSPAERAEQELEALLPAPAVAKLRLLSKEVQNDTMSDALHAFAAQLTSQEATN